MSGAPLPINCARRLCPGRDFPPEQAAIAMSNVWIELGLNRVPDMVASLLTVIGDMAPESLGLDTASFRDLLRQQSEEVRTSPGTPVTRFSAALRRTWRNARRSFPSSSPS
jgi:hypothetical protein